MGFWATNEQLLSRCASPVTNSQYVSAPINKSMFVLSKCAWLANYKFFRKLYFSTAIRCDWFFNLLHFFGTPNAVITLLWSLHIDLTTISYSDNFKLDSSVLRNGANLSSFTSWSDINVCWFPVSNKILTTQNWSSRLFMTHALAFCSTIVVSLFTKQVAVRLLAGGVMLLLFWSGLFAVGLVCCE